MPFHTPTALPLPLSESAPRVFYQRLSLDATDNAVGSISASADLVPLMVPYGIRRGSLLILTVPLQRRALRVDGVSQTRSGIGDVSLMAKQELFEADIVGGNRRLALFAGISLPSGRTEDRGEALPPPLRLGTGTSVFRADLAYSHVDGRLGAHGVVGYAGAVGTSFGVRPGSKLSYGIAGGYRLAPSRFQTLREPTWALYVELNGVHERAASEGAETVPETGGDLVFLSPGLQVMPRPNLLFEGSLQWPIVRRLRGAPLEPEGSVAVGVRHFLGFLAS